MVGVRGFDPNASQPVEIGIATSVNVDQLVPNTDYDVYVRTICGNSNNSLWVKTSFTTKQLPAQLPFVCDFENAAQNAEWSIVGNNASQFYIGSAVASQGNNALYISNENGNNNQYDPNSNAYAFAFRSLHFEGGVYNINFSWQAQGEYNADLGSVFLAPASAVILPNSNNGIYSTYSCPEGWQRIGQPLQSSSYWQTFNTSVSVPEPGAYLLVCYGTNNSNAIEL